MIKKTRKILITNVGSGVGNGIITSIKNSPNSYEVIGINEEPFHSGTFRCNKVYLTNAGVKTKEWWNKVIEIIRKENPKIIFTTGAIDGEIVAHNKDVLQKLGVVSTLPNEETQLMINDKLQSVSFFEKLGLPYVKTVDSNNENELKEFLIKNKFPLFIKPSYGGGSMGVHIVDNRKELNTYLKDKQKRYIVQEFLPPIGPLHSLTNYTKLIQDREYSIQTLFSPKGKMLGWFASINTLDDGTPMAIRVTRSKEVLDCIKILKENKLKLTGLLNIQGRIKDGKIIFFEANARCTNISGTRAMLDFNEIDAIWESFIEGRDIKMVEVPDGVVIYRYLQDVYFTKDRFKSLVTNNFSNSK